MSYEHDINPVLNYIYSNELNSAYSADGYARVKEGLGVLVTTYVSHREMET
jgi:TPP-dependent 2-oxoacid decarboxylase